MKTLLSSLLLFFALTNALGQENIKSDTSSSKTERYRLSNKKKNFFRVCKDRIKIVVPVTDKSLRYQGVTDISSDTISAILVHIKGNDRETECSQIKKKIRKKRIKISKILGLNRENLFKQKKMIVAFYNNDSCTPEDIQCFKEIIRIGESDKQIVEELNKYNRCGKNISPDEDSPCKKRPKESGGDVIGGY